MFIDIDNIMHIIYNTLIMVFQLSVRRKEYKFKGFVDNLEYKCAQKLYMNYISCFDIGLDLLRNFKLMEQ